MPLAVSKHATTATTARAARALARACRVRVEDYGATAGRLAGRCSPPGNFACNARPCRLPPGFELGVSRLCASQWTRRARAGTSRGHRGRGHMTALNAVNETRLRFASSDEGGTALKPTDSPSCSHFAPMPQRSRALLFLNLTATAAVHYAIANNPPLVTPATADLSSQPAFSTPAAPVSRMSDC